MKMNKKNVLVAAKALRETTKTQGYAALYQDGEYCAIGVICSEVLDIPDVRMRYGECADAYQAARKFLGCDIRSNNDLVSRIYYKSDGEMTFPQIADWLEGLANGRS